MRRNRRTTLGAVGSGVAIAAALFAGYMPAGAASSTPKVATPTPNAPTVSAPTSPKVTPAPAPAAVSTPKVATSNAPRNTSNVTSTPKATSATTSNANPLAPLVGLPISLSLPITLLGNEIGSMLLPGQDSLTSTNITHQTSPLINADVPVNACSISAGVLAGAKSSCSTTTVGITQLGAIGNVNIPITARDNAIGLLGMAASALGLTTGQSSATTTQDGAINAFVPVSLCAINVGLVGDTSSSCNTTGTHGTVNQKGVIDATVPVTVCDVIVEIVGNSTSDCPTHPNSVTQAGQLADVFAPVNVCGIIVELDGKAAGSCMPAADYPLVKGLPTNPLSQSAPIDGVLPVNACSIVVAIAGTATNSCEPSHVAPTQTGTLPINAPATVCAVTAALQGTATGTCVGSANTGLPIGIGSPGSGISLPITLCGIEAALGGTSNASCPNPVATLASTTPPGPVTLPNVTPPAAAKPAGALAFTGAPLVLELAIGLMALLAGLAISLLSRRQRTTSMRRTSH